MFLMIIMRITVFQIRTGNRNNELLQLCTALTVFSILVRTVIHCDARGVSLVDQ